MNSWPTKKLVDVAEIIMGQSPKGENYNDSGEGLPLYQGKRDFGGMFTADPEVWTSQTTKEARPNDILISVRAPVGPVNIANQRLNIGRGLAAIRPWEDLHYLYLFYFMRSQQNVIASLGVGSTFQSIIKKDLYSIEIPLPRIGEQKRIVAKLEKLLGKIEEAKKLRMESLGATQNLLPAELHKIFEEGKKKGWKEKRLGDIYVFNYGKGLPKSERKESGAYIVYGANGGLGRSDKYLVDGNGIIVGRKGSAGEITRVSGKYWPTDVTYYIQESEKYEIGFTYYLFKYLNFPQYAAGVKPGINRNQIYNIKIYFTPLAEQKKIVARLDALSEKVEELKKLQLETTTDLDALSKSILHQAFEGEL